MDEVVVQWLTGPTGPQDLERLVSGLAGHPVRVVRRCPRCGSGGHGRPLADDGAWHVSLARAGDRTVVVATTLGPVGVDVEADGPRPGLADVALHPSERGRDALRTWVRKEALLKATGDALTIDPRDVAVDPARGVTAWPAGPRPGARLLDLDAPPGLLASLVVLTSERVRTTGAPAA